MFAALSKQAGSVILENTTLSSHQKKNNDLFMSPKFSIRMINMLFNSSNGVTLAIFQMDRTNYPFTVTISIYNCTFFNNAYDIVVHLGEPTTIIFTMRNTIFTTKMAKHKDFGIFFSTHPKRKLNSSNVVIELSNITFEFRPSNIFQLIIPGKKSLKIKGSIFKGGFCLHKYVPYYNPL